MSTRRSGPGLPADFAFPAETPDSRRGALVTLAPRTYATATASIVAPVSVSAATARAPPASILRTPRTSAPASAPAMTTKWAENPNHGTFNPGTAEGRKIFERKTKGPADDKKISLLRKDAAPLRALLEGKTSDFGTCVSKVAVKYSGRNPSKFVNLMTEYHSITLDRMKREGH